MSQEIQYLTNKVVTATQGILHMFPVRTRSTPAPVWQWMSVNLQKDFVQTYQNNKWWRAREITRKSTSLRRGNSFQARQESPTAASDSKAAVSSCTAQRMRLLSKYFLAFLPSIPPSAPLPPSERACTTLWYSPSLPVSVRPISLNISFTGLHSGILSPELQEDSLKMATKHMLNKRGWKEKLWWIRRILGLLLELHSKLDFKYH